MPRTARVVVPGMPHHITQRGSRQSNVFRDESDRSLYLEQLIDSCHEFLLRIIAYCLMTNHVHFVAIPEREDSIQKVFHRVHGTHAQRFNKKYELVGHLWQERPFSCVLDEGHFWNAIRYVERNPVRAGLVNRAADYRWSSAAAHCNGEDDPVLSSTIRLERHFDREEWLGENENLETNKIIRQCTATGRPCGDDDFVKRVERITQRDFTRKPPGPKPKSGPASPMLPFDPSSD